MQANHSQRRVGLPAWMLLTAGCLGAGAPAMAQPGGAGGAFGLETTIDAVGILNVTVPPTPEVDSGPLTGDPFSLNDSVVNIDAGDGLVILGTFTVNTNFLGAPSTNVSSDATVVNLVLGGPIANLLSVTATILQSTADTGGICGESVNGTSTTTVQDLAITILGLPVAGIPSGNVSPNTVIALPAIPGLVSGSLTLHEQAVGGDGTNTVDVTANALHLVLDINVVGGGDLLNVDLVISSSTAAIDCTVPVELIGFTVE